MNRSRGSRSSVRDRTFFFSFPSFPFTLQGKFQRFQPLLHLFLRVAWSKMIPWKVYTRVGERSRRSYISDLSDFFSIYQRNREDIFAPSTSSVRSIIWKEKIYRGTVELAHVTGRFLNNSRPRHMSEAHPIFRPSCLEMVVLRITTWSGWWDEQG